MKKGLITTAKIYLITILLGLFQKIIFLTFYFERSSELDFATLLGVIFHGLILDISTAGYVTVLPMLMLLVGLWGGWRVSESVWRRCYTIYLSVVAVVMAVISSVDLNLYRYWGYRVDATLIPYLLTPEEATASLGFSDYVVALTSLALLLGASYFGYRWAIRGLSFSRVSYPRRALNTLVVVLLSGLMFVGIRGGVDESVANVSKVYFSQEQFANHAAVNPSFSLLSSLTKFERYEDMYPFFEDDKAESIVLSARPHSAPKMANDTLSRPNILFIICESFTKAIMDSEKEGREVMPRLKEIAAQGLTFNNCYATGTRTDRGVVSVLSGFPSQPSISIMKIPSKSRNLPSIAKVLSTEGYSTHFYYGGDLDFMDMSSYLYSTGWQHLTSLESVPRANEPKTKWGNSDGYMSGLVADSLEVLSRGGRPFLASWLTLSSHEPFDMPEDFGFKDPMINSMAYADAKVGALVDRLRGGELWDDLLVVIVADHTLGYPFGILYNSPLRYRIPLIVTGGAAERFGWSGERDEIVSQMDIVPTVLSGLGLGHSEFKYGRDIFSGVGDEYGYYTFSDGGAVVRSTGVSIYDRRGDVMFGAGLRDDHIEIGGEERDLELIKSLLQTTHVDISNM